MGKIVGIPLRIQVNEELRLEAGTWYQTTDKHGRCRVIEPPERTLFDQIIAYLDEKPPIRSAGYCITREAVALAAITVRWGSYYAVIADATKPLWSESGAPEQSRISDSEMARINIEASAALERWIDLQKTDVNRYLQLVARALKYLPLARRNARRVRESNGMCIRAAALKEGRDQILARGPHLSTYETKLAETRAHPTRVLANAVVHSCWRNGPVENVHAGGGSFVPLTLCRIPPDEDRALFRAFSDNLLEACSGIFWLIHDTSGDPWERRVLPYALGGVAFGIMFPQNWTVTEFTRRVVLSGQEPE
jgi:hypothetical protein